MHNHQCGSSVEEAINLSDKLINQCDITRMNSCQEVYLHKIMRPFIASLISKQRIRRVSEKGERANLYH